MKAKDLKQDKRNYRKHSDRNKELIRKSVTECGLGRSVLVDADGVLIAGNGVASSIDKDTPVRVVETDGSELVVVKRTDLHTDDAKRRLLALADNATSDSSEWDVDTLTADWGEVELKEWEIRVKAEKENEVSGDVKFSEVMDEEHNYIVLFFDNGVDWLQAQTLFDLKPVMTLPNHTDGSINKKLAKKGLGRIINGAQAINKLMGK